MATRVDRESETATSNLDMSGIGPSVGFQLRRAQAAIFQTFLARFSSYDLRPTEFCTLVLIADNPGRKQSEIAAALGVQRANFVALINELERRRLIERRNAPHDRRSNALYLTTKGSALVADARRTEAQVEDEYTARLGGVRARDQLLILLGRLAG